MPGSPQDPQYSFEGDTDASSRSVNRADEIYGVQVHAGDRVLKLDEDIDHIIHECVRALSFGDRKYGVGTWKDIGFDKFLAALMRHVGKRMGGEVLDQESGIDHLGHAMANCVLIYRKLK